MLGAVRHFAALLLMIVFGLPFSLVSWLVVSFVEHVFETVFFVLPEGHARFVVGAIVAHNKKGRCWRCGERGPTYADLLHHHHHPPGPPAAP